MRERSVGGSGFYFRVLLYQALLAPFPHHLYNLFYCLWIAFGTGQAVIVAESGRRTAGWILVPQLTVGVVMMVVVVVVMHMVMMATGRRQVRDVLDTDVIQVTAGRPVVPGHVLREVGRAGRRTGQVRIENGCGNCGLRATSHATAVGLRCTVCGLLLASDYFVLTIRHRFVAMEQPARRGTCQIHN